MSIRKLFTRTGSSFFHGVMILFLLAGSLGTFSDSHALGLAIEVNTTADNVTKDGLCSLREAITNANRNYQYYPDCTGGVSDDGILFANSLGAATITITSPLPPITDRVGLVIDGGGDITISGGLSHQIFTVNTRAPLTLNKLVITRGRNAASKGGGLYSYGGFVTISNSSFVENSAVHGGALYTVGGYVTITNSTFSRNGAGINTPGDNDGGAIYNDGSSMNITDSTFSQNGAYSEGGGIYIASGPTTITHSTFSGNGDFFIYGAAIYAASGQLTITLSTFSNNTANLAGGVFVASGTADIGNSTFSGNRGGGIENLGVLLIKNSTFSGNTSNVAGGIINMGTLTIFNTILANTITGRDCFNNTNATVSGNNNLIEADGLTPNACGTGALNVDPRLGTLTGSPAYFPLNAGSPAINGGDDAYCASWPTSNTSQNGVTRPQGAHCEIGSYESPSAALAASPQEALAAQDSEVWVLVDQGGLSAENGKLLATMLEGAIQSLDGNDPDSAAKWLGSYIDEVNALIKSAEFESAAGQQLIDAAQEIQNNLY